MKLATTTYDFACLATHEERVRHIVDAGFRHIDLNLYEDADILPFMGEDWAERALALRRYAESLGADFVQAHSPGGNPLGSTEEQDKIVRTTCRSIEVCELLGIPCTVVHSGYLPGVGKEEYYRLNRAFYERLLPTAERCGVMVLIENSTRANMGEKYFFFDGADMAEFLDWMGHPLLHACWDTGHANVEGHQCADLLALGSHLKALHINDNRGRMDEHLMPYAGSVSMDEVMDGLLRSGYQGYFTLEASSTPIRPGNWLVPKSVWPAQQRLLEPPLFLYDGLERLLYQLGEYILKAYDCLEP